MDKNLRVSTCPRSDGVLGWQRCLVQSAQAQSKPELRGSVNLCVELTPLHARTHDLLSFKLATRT